ncbi:MAG: cation:proton antiporter, partial [Myxococcales bacterium]|nr:cation:proton antiporter [Myxococcales bacterium]
AQSPGGIALEFVKVVGVGALIGGGVGLAASQVTMRVDEPMIEITLTTIAAYGSFAIAEHLHFSGVIAVVVAGMVCGNYGAKHGMSPSTKLAVESFWEYVAFALNSAVFLFIGFQVRIGALVHAWRPILVAFAAVTMARVVVVYGVTTALGRTSEKTPWSWRAVMAWGGLRGGLSMVLALSLPSSVESREFLVNLTFGVVLLSIVLQGLTMGPLLRRLGIAGHTAAEKLAFEEHRAVLRATTTALGRLEEMVRDGQLTETSASEVRGQYEQRRAEARSALAGLHLAQKEIEEEEVRAATRQLILVERAAVNEAHERGLVGRAAYGRLIEDVDARLLREEDD